MKIKDWHKELFYFLIAICLIILLERNNDLLNISDGDLPNTTNGKGGLLFLMYLNKIGGKYLVYGCIFLVGLIFLKRAINKFKKEKN